MRREDTVVSPMPSPNTYSERAGGARAAGAPASAWDNVETRVDAYQASLPLKVSQTVPPAGAAKFLHSSTAVDAPNVVAFRPPTQPPSPVATFRAMPPAMPSTSAPRASAPHLTVPSAPLSPAAAAGVATKGQVLVFFGCRGGAGTTTLAVNAAASLARAGKKVCLLDLDLQLGDVFVALDLEPNTSIAALAREAGTIDASALVRRLARHDSGVYALGQTGRLDDVDPQLAERMPALLACLCDHFDVVIVDGVRDFGDCALAALDMADRVSLVLTQDVPAVRRAARVREVMAKLGYSDRKVQVVVNRHTAKAQVSEAELERALAMPIAARVRNDYRRMSSALNDGALLHDVARGAAVTKDLDALAAAAIGPGMSPAKAPQAKPGLLARLFSRSAKGGK